MSDIIDQSDSEPFEESGSESNSEPYQDSGSEFVFSDEDYEESSDEPSVTDPPTTSRDVKSRKRVRHEKKWRRSVAKKKRCAGEEYTTRSNRVVPAKSFSPCVCGCKHHCNNLIPEERQRALHQHFYSLDNFDFQTAHLFSLIKVENKLRTYTGNPQSRREKTRIFLLPDENGAERKVCKKFFQAVYQVSAGRIDRLLKNKSAGAHAPQDRRGKHIPSNKTPIAKTNEVKSFIDKFPCYESHYSREKSNHRKYLAPNLSIGKMFELYKAETMDPVTYAIFRRIFNTEYNLHFHPPISDSCRKCDFFNIKIKASNEEQKKQLEKDLEFHQRKAKAARDGLKHDIQRAKNDEVSVICFDLMKTLPTPVLTTGICYYKRQLWTYCFNVHDMGTDNSYMFIWDETVASRGPQEIGSCLLHYIKNFPTSRKIIMYSDQCGGQNRNIKLSLLCNFITASPDFNVEEIDHKFLVSGHSYLPCDQDFGLIEKEKKFHPHIFVPSDWISVIENARKKNPFKVIQMTSSDFVSTKPLESNITNRKQSETKTKVEWLKIQWLRFNKESPDKIQYKYSNNEYVSLETVDIRKRGSRSTELITLPLLYPKGNVINVAKKKDLLQLIEFIPPIHHDFYRNMKASAQATGGELLEEQD